MPAESAAVGAVWAVSAVDTTAVRAVNNKRRIMDPPGGSCHLRVGVRCQGDNGDGATWLLGGVDYPVQSFAVGRARRQLRAVLQNHHVFTMKPWLQLFDAIDVDDRRPVHAHEAVRGEAGLEALELLAHDVGLTPHVELHVFAVGLDPVTLTGL